MDQIQDVTQNSSSVESSVSTQSQLPDAPVVTSDAVPGSKTPPENLLIALQKERERVERLQAEKQILEDKLANTTEPTEETYSEEGKELKQEIQALKDRIELKELQDKFPQLKELSSEFNEFRKDYPRNKMESVVKLFLTEKGLLESQRKGLEAPTGGTRVPAPTKMTPDEITQLRQTNYKKYADMVRKGLIEV